MTRIWDKWLPLEVREKISNDEPKRYEIAVVELKRLVEHAKNSEDPDRWTRTLPWLELIKSMVSSRSEYGLEANAELSRTMYDLVISSTDDVEVQVRWSEALVRCLRTYRKALTGKMVLPWKPLYQLLRSLVEEPVPALRGGILDHARHTGLFEVVVRARRFFSVEACQEIWEEFRPLVCAPHADSRSRYRGLGWLVVFMPTKKLGQLPREVVSEWMAIWVALWDEQFHCNFWDCHWMYLIARTAKDDDHGVVDWSPHLSCLFTKIMAAFNVPVGTATATPPISRGVPSQASAIFGNKVDQVDDVSKSAAKLMVHLLKDPGHMDEGEGTLAVSDSAMSALEAIVELLEQYYHPSNGGSWTWDLTIFLKQAVHYFVKFLGRQGARSHSNEDGMTISEGIQARFIQCIVKVAGRSQFAKDHGLVSASCTALSHLAYLAPGLVLPLVVQRFQSALETAVATHQLATAVNTLALCVRPMLLTGWQPEEGHQQEELGADTLEILSEAMTAVLPGIDANDEAKTAAVFQFYTAVLASVPHLGAEGDAGEVKDGGVRLPLYVEDWVDLVLERIFTLLQNMDTGPGTRADQTYGKPEVLLKATHLGRSAVFSQFFRHLFLRLSPSLCGRVIQQIKQFLFSYTLPTVASEAAMMLWCATHHYPEMVVEQVLKPLVERTKKDLPLDELLKVQTISRNLEAQLTWRLVIIAVVLGNLNHDLILPLVPQLKDLVDHSMKVPSSVAHNWSSLILGLTLTALTSHALEPEWGQKCPLMPSGLVAWADKEGAGFLTPEWVAPSQEALRVAEKLVEEYLLGSCAALRTLCSQEGETASGDSLQYKMKVQVELVKISAVLGGLLSRLRDFSYQLGDNLGMPLALTGCRAAVLGPTVVRECVAAALSHALRYLRHTDRELLELCQTCSMMVLCPGSLESSAYQKYVTGGGGHRGEAAIVVEPSIAGRYYEGDTYGQPWRKRVGPQVALDRVRRHMIWRTAQHTTKSFMYQNSLEVDRADQFPAEFLELVGEVVDLAMFPYQVVRGLSAHTLGSVYKRFPVLVKLSLPQYLSAVSLVPAPKWPQFKSLTAESSSTETTVVTIEEYEQQEAAFMERIDTAAAADRKMSLPGAGSGDREDEAAGKPSVPDNGPSGAAAEKLKPPLSVKGLGTSLPSKASDVSKGGKSIASESENDAKVSGACTSMVMNIEVWRLIFRQPSWLKCTLQALMASRVHTSSPCMAALSALFVQVASRFRHPMSQRFDSPMYRNLVDQLLTMAKPGQLRGLWRYTVVANGFLLYLIPPVHPSNGGMELTSHFLGNLQSDVLLLRQLAMAGLYFQLTPLVDFGWCHPGIVEVVSQSIVTPGPVRLEGSSSLVGPGFGTRLLHHLALDHTKLDVVEANKDKRMGTLASLQSKLAELTFEELIEKIIYGVMERYRDWPGDGHGRPTAMKEGLFEERHATLVRLLASVAPGEMLTALKGPLLEAIERAPDVSNTAEKAEQCAAAEVMAGLLASGAPFLTSQGGDGGSDEHGWVVEQLSRALRRTTLDVSDSWSTAVRYATHYLLKRVMHKPSTSSQGGHPPTGGLRALTDSQAVAGLKQVLDCVLCAPGGRSGCQLPSELKRLRYLRSVMAELRSVAPSAELPPEVRGFWGGALEELSSLIRSDQHSLREHIGALLVVVCAYFYPDSRKKLELGQSGGEGTEYVDVSCTGLEDMAVDHPRSEAGTASCRPSSPQLEVEMGDGEPMVLLLHSSLEQLQRQAALLRSHLTEMMNSHTQYFQHLRGTPSTSNANGGDSAMPAIESRSDGLLLSEQAGASRVGGKMPELQIGSDTPTYSRTATPPLPDLSTDPSPSPDQRLSAAVAQVGFGLQFLIHAMRHGDLAPLRDLIVSLLPALFRLQELAGPQLQPLAMEAQTSYVLVKYLPLRQDQVSSVISSVVNCSAVDLWSTRAAGLVFLQYFWFRHCFLLDQHQLVTLQDHVVAQLEDTKVEVRNIASATLSGMLRGMGGEGLEKLRRSLVDRAAKIFKKTTRTSRGARAVHSGEVTLLLKQSCIQGLKAFVMSSPYDCPAWMPEVLLALVAAAHDPSPQVRTEASKVVSEYKRTHEQESMEQLRSRLEEEQWEDLQQVTSTASYFV